MTCKDCIHSGLCYKENEYDRCDEFISNKVLEERLTGEWIEEPDTLGVIEKGNAKYRCSCCGHTDIQAKSLDVPYCWFCGAEMAEKNIDED